MGGVFSDDGTGGAHATQVVASRRKAGNRRQAGLLAEGEKLAQVEEE